MPSQTLAASDPRGDAIPIDHFVIVMQENRSFDHYLSNLPAYGQPDVDVAGPDARNLDPEHGNAPVHPYLLPHPCSDDLPHDAKHVRDQFHDGKMDGFVAVANEHGRQAMGKYDAATLPYYYALANSFAIGDRYFASFLGPTWPNRMFFISGSSFGHITNVRPEKRDEETSLFHQLERASESWILYANTETFEEQMFPVLRAEKGDHFHSLRRFFEDAERGTLPNLAWVESSYGGPMATDEHPPADVQLGQRFVAEIVNALFKSPNWKRSALILVYDEHGGYFDHVSPPPACAPNPRAPTPPGNHNVRFDHLGIRVPFIVVSPFAKRHFVSHRVYDHTSVLRLVQARFDLPAMTARDANATPPYDLFDFANPPFVEPPPLPEATVDKSELTYCENEFAEHKHHEKTILVPKSASK
jgi:phospholipase C